MKKVLRKSNLVACILILIVGFAVAVVFAGDVVVKEGELNFRRGAIGDGISTSPTTLLKLGDLTTDSGDKTVIDAKLLSDANSSMVFDFEVTGTSAIGIVRATNFKAGHDGDAPMSLVGQDVYVNLLQLRGAGTVGNNLNITQGTFNWYALRAITQSAVASGQQGHPSGGTFNIYAIDITGEPSNYEDATLDFRQINLADAGSGYSIYDSGGDWVLDDDNSKIILGEDQDAEIFWDETNLKFDYGSPPTQAYFSGNISVNDCIERGCVYDKSRGKALDFIKDASDYKDASGNIKYSNFYGYTTYEVTDYDRPIVVTESYTYPGDDVNEVTVYYDKTTYPYKKIEEGISMGGEIDVLRQAVYELKQEVQILKNELCSKDPSYGWCE